MGCMNQKNARHNSYDTEAKSPTKTYTNNNNYDYQRPTYQKPYAEKKSYTSPNNLTVAKVEPRENRMVGYGSSIAAVGY